MSPAEYSVHVNYIVVGSTPINHCLTLLLTMTIKRGSDLGGVVSFNANPTYRKFSLAVWSSCLQIVVTDIIHMCCKHRIVYNNPF